MDHDHNSESQSSLEKYENLVSKHRDPYVAWTWWRIIVKWHSEWGLYIGSREAPLYESHCYDHASITRYDSIHRQVGSNTISHVNELDNDIFFNNSYAYFLLDSIAQNSIQFQDPGGWRTPPKNGWSWQGEVSPFSHSVGSTWYISVLR